MADITLSITIPDAKVAKVRAGFLAARPKEPGFAGTDAEWFEEVWRRLVTVTTQKGLRMLAAKNEPVESSYTD